jgi:hypothetical protein
MASQPQKQIGALIYGKYGRQRARQGEAMVLKGTEWVLREIDIERKRQIEKFGYDASEDDGQIHGELAEAACYMAWPSEELPIYDDIEDKHYDVYHLFPTGWDIDTHTYRQGKTPRECLLVAAALIVAEIERLDRKEK